MSRLVRWFSLDRLPTELSIAQAALVYLRRLGLLITPPVVLILVVLIVRLIEIA